MSGQSHDTPAVLISGDTLALDPEIRGRIFAEAQRLKQRYPTMPVTLRIGISEEFDQARGHRIRCELAADLPGKQVMVREAHKEPAAAIAAVFTAAKRQLRRIRSLGPAQDGSASREVQTAGT
jgi:ribosome-associated translation inhibitor RaiA